MTHTEHAQQLADKLHALLDLNLFAEGGAHLVEVAEARAALDAWASRVPDPHWVKSSEACDRLGIHFKTLKRWRDLNRITPGVHWRRMNEGGHCVYNLPLLQRRMEELAVLGS